MNQVKVLLLAVLLSWGSGASAEQMKRLGNWDVHYMALDTTFITPEVARAYGIHRSRYNGLVNIAVLNSADKKAQSVAITGKAKNLLGVTKPLTFKEVVEGDAIYSIAVIPFRNEEKYQFTIDIRHGNQHQVLKFKHQFYAE